MIKYAKCTNLDEFYICTYPHVPCSDITENTSGRYLSLFPQGNHCSILKVEPMGFVDGLAMGCETKEKG